MTRDEAATELAMTYAPEDFGPGMTCFTNDETFSVDPEEHHQRRLELINEPDDADAPEWVRYRAQDGDGNWYWYEYRPALAEDFWEVNKGKLQFAHTGRIPAGHDWRTTLKPVERELPAPEWDGESWPPPVGSIVESFAANKDGAECEVLAHRGDKVIACTTDDAHLAGWITEEGTRPIRTPQQRAEDEAVDAMASSVGYPDCRATKDVCRKLYRAGYRKP
jgi:hypothetical protein